MAEAIEMVAEVLKTVTEVLDATVPLLLSNEKVFEHGSEKKIKRDSV